MILAPFCERKGCEEKIKADSTREYVRCAVCLCMCCVCVMLRWNDAVCMYSPAPSVAIEPGAPAMGAKSLCIPFKQPELPAGMKVCLSLVAWS